MDERYRSDSRDLLSRGDTDTDDIDISALHESGMTQTFENATRERAERFAQPESEADIILIAHPESQRLGSRYRLSPGTTLEGPMIVEEFGSTVPIHPGFQVRVDDFLNLIVTRSQA